MTSMIITPVVVLLVNLHALFAAGRNERPYTQTGRVTQKEILENKDRHSKRKERCQMSLKEDTQELQIEQI